MFSSGSTPAVVDHNGDYVSGSFSPQNAGDYFWRAFYSGDANNTAVSTPCGDTGETSTMSPVTPTIITTATNADVGGSISDTAHISGLSNPIDGTITFSLFSDDECTNEVFSSGSTPAVVDHNGDYVSDSFSPQNAGDYFWRAFYSGDANNTAVSTPCGDTGETSTISPVTPTIITTATSADVGGSISDTAHISGLSNPIDGTITFSLFSDDECTNEVFSSGSTPAVVDHNGDYVSGSFSPQNAGDYFWRPSTPETPTTPPSPRPVVTRARPRR